MVMTGDTGEVEEEKRKDSVSSQSAMPLNCSAVVAPA